MITCTRRIQFCAGHRLWKHEGKCAHLHGHNYVVLFQAKAPELDSVGRVIDFQYLKTVLGSWIERNWDHGFILCRHDREACAVLETIPGQKLYFMDCNPTAENMASYLLNTIAPKQLAGTSVEITKVILWETENCFAEVCRGD
jgi:6-pyruvoyltetrahydropterin/6-carboxytetrahydropterin synthase